MSAREIEDFSSYARKHGYHVAATAAVVKTTKPRAGVMVLYKVSMTMVGNPQSSRKTGQSR